MLDKSKSIKISLRKILIPVNAIETIYLTHLFQYEDLMLFKQLLLYQSTNLNHSITHFQQSYGLPLHFNFVIHQ